MKTRILLAAAAVLFIPALPASADTVAVPDVQGPQIAPILAPQTTLTVFEDEYYTCTEAQRFSTVSIPAAPFSRAIVELTITPDGDPWDRLFGLTLGGVEILRGTTPRTTATYRRDITEYATLLAPGTDATFSLALGTYVGAMKGTVSLELYPTDEPTAALVRAPRKALGVFALRNLNGNQSSLVTLVDFGVSAPAKATVELTLSGHGGEEFWYQNSPVPREFLVKVGDVTIARTRSAPYVYALLGFGGANANIACVGPGTSALGDTVHPVMWWTAQKALDEAGIHTGNGRIPSFRGEISSDHLPLLTGERQITVTQVGGGPRWVTSAALLLD